MRILFLNQYFPPDPAPTGVLFREVADDLIRAGHMVDFVDAGQDYRAGQGGGGRMKRELMALWRMLREGCARPQADVVVSGTSPPCLAVVADRVARRHGAAHFHWAMDVYPELAIELGEIGRGSLVAKITRSAMGRAYRRAQVVVLDADMALRFREHRVESVCIRPWVSQSVIAASATPVPAEAPWTWMYSGNLGRAHEWETLLRAQAAIESSGSDARLMFQGGGPSRAAAQARAGELGLRNCEWRGYVPEAELPASLLRRGALAVTQLSAAQGLLWPSKLALLMTLPRPILFVGPTDGAIARELGALPHAGIFAPGDVEGVVRWISRMRVACTVPGPMIDANAQRADGLRRWREIIERCAKIE